MPRLKNNISQNESGSPTFDHRTKQNQPRLPLRTKHAHLILTFSIEADELCLREGRQGLQVKHGIYIIEKRIY